MKIHKVIRYSEVNGIIVVFEDNTELHIHDNEVVMYDEDGEVDDKFMG